MLSTHPFTSLGLYRKAECQPFNPESLERWWKPGSLGYVCAFCFDWLFQVLCVLNMRRIPQSVMLSNKNFMSCMLVASWPKRFLLALFSSEEKERRLFCSVLVMLIVGATPRPFESVPSNLNSYVKFFWAKPAISMKGISCPVHTVSRACIT